MTRPLRLPRGEVHSWCVTLDVPAEVADGLYATLSADERNRSARFRFERDRRRFVVAHGALRELLGCYLGTHPGHVRFAHNACGKPALSPECGTRLRFNLSHSAGCALIAIAADADIGVDLEYIRPLPDHAEIAQHFFSAADVATPQAFFGHWTRHEAYVKACGEGLDSTAPAPDRRWSVFSLEPAPGYIGAVVVEGSGWRVRPSAPTSPRLSVVLSLSGAHRNSDLVRRRAGSHPPGLRLDDRPGPDPRLAAALLPGRG